ncbi:MAG: hydroxyacid-oxoacid transhydrogenase [Haliangiales bacterium]
MACGHHFAVEAGCDAAFTVEASRVTFGRGCLDELGARARAHKLGRVAVFTDRTVAALPIVERALTSLKAAGVDVALYDDVHVEPTDSSFRQAAAFAADAAVDGFVSVGGGSVMDTCKAANLYATYPAALSAYVNAPIGDAQPVPGPLLPHIACPTTSGTGSEVTGIAIFDWVEKKVKTGIASGALRPTEALVDPDCTDTLPGPVVAASGLDVLCHALESYTARPFSKRPLGATAGARPTSQGANPWSDLGCREALRLLGRSFLRAVQDADDRDAREQVMWAATLAGIAFGNAGVHIPHGMSYAVAGLVRDYRPAGYPQHEPMVPHGMSVAVNAPAVFRWTAEVSPERHLEAAQLLGADVAGAEPSDAGERLATQLTHMMKGAGMPNGLSALGYREGDVSALCEGAFAQQRLLQNAPREVTLETLAALFRGGMSSW